MMPWIIRVRRYIWDTTYRETIIFCEIVSRIELTSITLTILSKRSSVFLINISDLEYFTNRSECNVDSKFIILQGYKRERHTTAQCEPTIKWDIEMSTSDRWFCSSRVVRVISTRIESIVVGVVCRIIKLSYISNHLIK